MAEGCRVVKKFQFLGKILHSKSLRVINGGSGITKCNQQKLFGTENAQGSSLEESVGPGWGQYMDPGKRRGLRVSEERQGLEQEWAVAQEKVTPETELEPEGLAAIIKAGSVCKPVPLVGMRLCPGLTSHRRWQSLARWLGLLFWKRPRRERCHLQITVPGRAVFRA